MINFWSSGGDWVLMVIVLDLFAALDTADSLHVSGGPMYLILHGSDLSFLLGASHLQLVIWGDLCHVSQTRLSHASGAAERL